MMNRLHFIYDLGIYHYVKYLLAAFKYVVPWSLFSVMTACIYYGMIFSFSACYVASPCILYNISGKTREVIVNPVDSFAPCQSVQNPSG